MAAISNPNITWIDLQTHFLLTKVGTSQIRKPKRISDWYACPLGKPASPKESAAITISAGGLGRSMRSFIRGATNLRIKAPTATNPSRGRLIMNNPIATNPAKLINSHDCPNKEIVSEQSTKTESSHVCTHFITASSPGSLSQNHASRDMVMAAIRNRYSIQTLIVQ